MWRWLLVEALVVSTLFGSNARADDWASPEVQTIVSPNGQMKAIITPASSSRSGARVTVAGGTRPGTSFTTPWMPVDQVLFDDGSLLALDQWGEMGHGNVATLYERGGKVRWSKTLVELLGKAFADSAPRTTSSRWWRKQPLEWSLAADGKSVLVTLHDENQLQLMLHDGRTKQITVTDLQDDPERLVNRAHALVDAGNGAAALPLLERAIDTDPDLLDAVNLYVETLQRANQHARVVKALERESTRWTLHDGTGLANVYTVWGASLSALSRRADAERVLRLGVSVAPLYTIPTIALATLLVDDNRRKDADAVLDAFVSRLLAQTNLDDYGLLTIADFYRAHGDLAKALASYLKAYKKTEVTNQFLYENLASLYEQLGNDAEAIRIDEQLLAHFLKMGSAFEMYITSTRAALTRLRAKKHP